MAQNSVAKTDSLDKIALNELGYLDQLIVETCNSTYVFLWGNLYSSRLIHCSNNYIDVGDIHLLGSYPNEPDPLATGCLKVGEAMLYIPHLSLIDPADGIPGVWTSPICKLRIHQPVNPPARLQPGLRQPQSQFAQDQLANHQSPFTEQKFEGSPVLWTPTAPKIPRSSVSASLINL